jgi:tetratricopeptide (TPR) repeat protein
MPERSDGPSRDRKPAGAGGGARRSSAPRTGSSSRTGSGAPRTGSAAGAPAARPPRPERPERAEKPAGPPLPPGADPKLVPGDVRRELRALPEPVAERIAAHLVAAGMLVDDDPALAYEHAKAAKAQASRVGSVREAVGVTAYRAGDFAAALTELKAARRITGQPDHLPLLADCERALGHPDRALAYAADPDKARLDRASQVELAIVVSGARRDLGQGGAAVLALQGAELDSDAVEAWTPRLWYAYAEALLAAGRTEEAVSWFTAVATIDELGETDAEERLLALSRPAAE